MKNRLAQILKERGIRQQDLADQLGVSRQAVGYWTKAETLSAKNAAMLCAHLKVPLSELFGAETSTEGDHIIKVEGIEPLRPGYIRVPVLDVSGSCGCDGDLNDSAGDLVTGAVDLAAWFIQSLPGVVSARQLEIIASTGDSMIPTIEERSLVIIDKAQQAIRSDGVYCLRVDGELFIKRIMRNIDGTLTLISDNPRYPQRSVNKADLPLTAVLGRVVYAFNGRNI